MKTQYLIPVLVIAAFISGGCSRSTDVEARLSKVEADLKELKVFFGTGDAPEAKVVKPTIPAKHVVPEFTFSSEQLVIEKTRNAAAFDQKYRGKGFKISGTPSKIAPKGVEIEIVDFRLTPPSTRIEFEFPPERRQELATLSQGQAVTLIGEYRGQQGDNSITLENCSVAK